MEMVKVKTAELIGQPLNWAVAKSNECLVDSLEGGNVWIGKTCSLTDEVEKIVLFCPSLNWAQGGEIIDREDIELVSFRRDNEHGKVERVHRATISPEFQFQNYRSRMSRYTCDGPTKLVAAMRCYVTWKLGEEVEVPKELL